MIVSREYFEVGLWAALQLDVRDMILGLSRFDELTPVFQIQENEKREGDLKAGPSSHFASPGY